jgi:predicted  nucleic acid-binding Zn-ribbon protein
MSSIPDAIKTLSAAVEKEHKKKLSKLQSKLNAANVRADQWRETARKYQKQLLDRSKLPDEAVQTIKDLQVELDRLDHHAGSKAYSNATDFLRRARK